MGSDTIVPVPSVQIRPRASRTVHVGASEVDACNVRSKLLDVVAKRSGCSGGVLSSTEVVASSSKKKIPLFEPMSHSVDDVRCTE